MLWIERTPADFTFNIKAYSLLTNHPTRPTRSTRTSRRRSAGRDAREAERLSGQAARRGRRRGVATVPRRADAAALGGQARRRAVPVPAVVHDRRKNKAYIEECAARLPDYRVAVEFRHKSWMKPGEHRGDALLPGGAEPAVRVRRHAAGVRLQRAADRRGHRGRPVDGAVPRPRPHGVDQQERDRVANGSATTTPKDELQEWVPRIEGLAAADAGDPRPDEQLLPRLRGAERTGAGRPSSTVDLVS